MIPSDSLTSMPASSITISLGALVALGLAFFGSAITLGIAAINAIKASSHREGQLDEFQRATNARLAKLEQSDTHAITREELDALLRGMSGEISALNTRFNDFLMTFRGAVQK